MPDLARLPLSNKKSRLQVCPERRGLGAFYTPIRLSQCLVNWAIRTQKDKILEPGFGGCNFIEASRARLLNLENDKPAENIYGCDKDPNAFDFLTETLGEVNLEKRFIKDDFLSLKQVDFNDTEFDAVVGNPPYVSHHALSPETRASALKTITDEGFTLDGKASLWAYFVLHAFTFLKKGGRVAWVLPGSFIYADYSKLLRKTIVENSRRCLTITLSERVFLHEGTTESSVILLVDGWKEPSLFHKVESIYCDSITELEKKLENWHERTFANAFMEKRNSFSFFSSNELKCFNHLSKHKDMKKLGELADVKIGIVTGANAFFIIDKETASKNNLPKGYLTPILSKVKITKGLDILPTDFNRAKKENFRCLFLNTLNKKNFPHSIETYLENFPGDRAKNVTFSKRSVWYEPHQGETPDAFFTYMCNYAPRLILNLAKTNSTNTIHRVYFKKPMSNSNQKLAIISLLTSFSQLSAEVEGRSYGSGVLKHEPNEARAINLFMPPLKEDVIDEAYRTIDTLLREGEHIDGIRKVADEYVLKPILGESSEKHIAAFSSAIHTLRRIRHTSTSK